MEADGTRVKQQPARIPLRPAEQPTEPREDFLYNLKAGLRAAASGGRPRAGSATRRSPGNRRHPPCIAARQLTDQRQATAVPGKFYRQALLSLCPSFGITQEQALLINFRTRPF